VEGIHGEVVVCGAVQAVNDRGGRSTNLIALVELVGGGAESNDVPFRAVCGLPRHHHAPRIHLISPCLNGLNGRWRFAQTLAEDSEVTNREFARGRHMKVYEPEVAAPGGLVECHVIVWRVALVLTLVDNGGPVDTIVGDIDRVAVEALRF